MNMKNGHNDTAISLKMNDFNTPSENPFFQKENGAFDFTVQNRCSSLLSVYSLKTAALLLCTVPFQNIFPANKVPDLLPFTISYKASGAFPFVITVSIP